MARVLFFRSELLPLSETFIAGQAAALDRYEPWFAGLKRVTNGLAIEDCRVLVLGQKNSLHEKIARRVYLRTGFAPAFLRSVEAIQPDLIHAHFATDACAALEIQKRLRVPVIATLYGYDVTADQEMLRKLDVGRSYLQRKQALWKQASLFICISEFIRQRALERGFPEEKLWVHPIGVDVDFFQPAEESKKAPLVLFVGRLVEKKGCAYLLRAMQLVEAQLPSAHLVVLGDGPLRSALEREARSIVRNCEFPGALPAAMVRQWMQKAAVVAIPSVTAASGDAEGLCMVACEAQAMKVPVVSFSGSGISESVADRETGLLVPPRDTHALADTILTVLQNEKLAEQMGAAGRKRVERLFNVKRQALLLEEKYDEILERQ